MTLKIYYIEKRAPEARFDQWTPTGAYRERRIPLLGTVIEAEQVRLFYAEPDPHLARFAGIPRSPSGWQPRRREVRRRFVRASLQQMLDQNTDLRRASAIPPSNLDIPPPPPRGGEPAGPPPNAGSSAKRI